MGFFSFKTRDTDRSISNTYSSRGVFPVTMVDDKNNKYQEDDYQGYGEFGGMDYYELIAKMNGLETRDDGIGLAFGDKPYLAPCFYENPGRQWVNHHPTNCPEQGFFYEEGDV